MWEILRYCILWEYALSKIECTKLSLSKEKS